VNLLAKAAYQTKSNPHINITSQPRLKYTNRAMLMLHQVIMLSELMVNRLLDGRQVQN